MREDGSPHVTPVWIDYDGENVLVNSARGRTKVTNVDLGEDEIRIDVAGGEPIRAAFLVDAGGMRSHVSTQLNLRDGDTSDPSISMS